MKIDGLALQAEIIEKLKEEINELKNNGITPNIAIVTLGDETVWQAYVGQKIKLADSLGIEKTLINLNPETTEEVIEVVKKLNNNPKIHGIIVQRPFPSQIDTKRVIDCVAKEKDIDGFRDDSPFEVPVFLAVINILKHIAQTNDVKNFLTNKQVLVVGKGGTAGGPVINGLKKLGVEPQVIDTQTVDPGQKYSEADIIISAVGKTGIINTDSLKPTSILIGIGIHRGEDGLTGDYSEDEVEDKVGYFTPTPKGVGPVNLAFLFENLIKAAQNS